MFAISAGHHPAAKGASYEDFNEYDEACRWVKCLQQYARKQGVNVVAVPTGKLQQKVAFINSLDNLTGAIEVHFNSAVVNGKHVGRGCETIICPSSKSGLRLAKPIQKILVEHFKKDRGIKDGWYQMRTHNLYRAVGEPWQTAKPECEHEVKKPKPDFFLAKTKCPALIIEPEFVHHHYAITLQMDATCSGIVESLKAIQGEK